MKKKYIVAILIAVLGFGGIASAQVSNPNIWKIISGSIRPVVSTWELGAATARIQKGWFTNLDASSATIGSIAVSGTVSGDMVVGGQVRASNGTSTAPSYSFNSDTNTGMLWGGNDIIKFNNNGTTTLTIAANGQPKLGFLASSTANLVMSDTLGNLYTSIDNRITSATSPLVLAANSLSINKASSTANGYLSSTDWTSFNGKVSSQWATSGSNISYVAGSVGVGTTNPQGKFHVANAGVLYSTFQNTTNSTFFEINPSTDGTYIDYGGGHLAFGTASGVLGSGWSEKMRVTSGGNVGIGTTAPAAKLHVSTSASGNTLLLYSNNTLPFNPTVLQNISSSNTNNLTETAIGLNLENSSQTVNTYSPLISFSRHSTSGSYNGIYGYIGGYAAGDSWSTESVYGDLVFGTGSAGSNGPLERLRITSEGNVGIGTAAPKAKLESVIGVNANPVTSGTTQTGGALRLRGGDNAVLDFGMNSVNTWIQATDLSDLSQKYNLNLNPNGGNVGIGTTAPTRKLHVKDSTAGQVGTIVLDNATSLRPMLQFSENGGGAISDGMSIEYDGRLAGGSNVININSLSGIPVTTFMSGGNVGIGTTAPGAKLDVNGSIHGTSYYSSDATIGTSTTINVRNSDNSGACTITVKNGLVTATNCP